jgi:hypothetical protein
MCIGTITLTYTTLLIHHTCTRLEVKAGSCKVCVHESNSVQSRQLRFFLWDWLIALSVSHWLSLALNRYVCTRTCSFWVGPLNHLTTVRRVIHVLFTSLPWQPHSTSLASHFQPMTPVKTRTDRIAVRHADSRELSGIADMVRPLRYW